MQKGRISIRDPARLRKKVPEQAGIENLVADPPLPTIAWYRTAADILLRSLIADTTTIQSLACEIQLACNALSCTGSAEPARRDFHLWGKYR